MGQEKNWTYRCSKHPTQTFRRFRGNYPVCPICRETMERVFENETNKKSKRKVAKYKLVKDKPYFVSKGKRLIQRLTTNNN